MPSVIKNNFAATIVVSTPLGVFTFPPKGSVELENDRAAAVQKAGHWYFVAGDLEVERKEASNLDKANPADEDGSNKVRVAKTAK